MIKCEFYKDGKCINSEAKLSAVSKCEHCFQGNGANACTLLCECEEACIIGEVVDETKTNLQK